MGHQHHVGAGAPEVPPQAGGGPQVAPPPAPEDGDVEARRPEVVGERAALAQAHQFGPHLLRVEVAEHLEQDHLGATDEGGVQDEAQADGPVGAAGHGPEATQVAAATLRGP